MLQTAVLWGINSKCAAGPYANISHFVQSVQSVQLPGALKASPAFCDSASCAASRP